MTGLFENRHALKYVMGIFYLVFIFEMLKAADHTYYPAENQQVFKLNGMEFVFDSQNGSLIRLSSSDGTTFLETTAETGSLVDLAYPDKRYAPRRLAPKFSKNVKIESAEGKVTVKWENLGASRSLSRNGRVVVTVQFAAAADGRSVIMTCAIENKSDQTIRQVLFPDLAGLLPFAGEKQTHLRSAAFVIEPFDLLKADVDMVPFYATGKFHVGNGWVEYKSGRYKSFSQKLVDWLDLGDVKNGFSLFARRWPPERQDISLMLHLSEKDHKLRLLFCHELDIAPGEKWQSDEYWLTSHQHGWAEGIEPFRDWAKANLKRDFNMPEHIRKGMGFRTLWMSKGLPVEQEQDVLYHFSDLPLIARESKAHGLNELVIWFWSNYFDLPVEIIDSLGSEQALIDAIAECRDLGVNVNLFMSVLYLRDPSAARYGLTPSRETSWTYHPDLIPNFNPPYASWYAAAMAEQSNLKWQEDVFSSFKTYIDLGLTSFVWDVFMAEPTTPNLYNLAEKIRIAADQQAAQSVFAGEGGCEIAEDYKYLDYTWNWNWNWPSYKDFRAYTSIFSAPRLNVNIEESIKVVNYCFADNAYMNIMPATPDGINASDLISNHPDLSKALKRCARLREQFLDYFINGKLIGECILAEETADAHISAYVLTDRILMILAKDDAPGPVSLTCDPDYWLGMEKRSGIVKIYNSEGLLTDTKPFSEILWRFTTPELKQDDLCLFEFIVE